VKGRRREHDNATIQYDIADGDKRMKNVTRGDMKVKTKLQGWKDGTAERPAVMAKKFEIKYKLRLNKVKDASHHFEV